MPRRDKSLSDLVRAYSVARQIPLRTAQDRAKKNHADWAAFVAAMGCRAVSTPQPQPAERQAPAVVVRAGVESAPQNADVAPHVAPPALAKPRAEWTAEEYAECEAWAGLVLANRNRDAALEAKDPLLAMQFVKLAADCYDTYIKARRCRVQAELEAGRLQPMSAWDQARAAVQKLAALLAGRRGELAQMVNPKDPIFAIKAIAEWEEQRFMPALRDTIEELTLAS